MSLLRLLGSTSARRTGTAHAGVEQSSIGRLLRGDSQPCVLPPCPSYAPSMRKQPTTSRLAGSARAAVEQLQLLGSRWRVPFPMHAAWQLQQTAALRTATQPKQDATELQALQKIPRSHTATGIAAVLAHSVFGRFMDLASSVALDGDTYRATLKLSVAMSASFLNTHDEASLAITRPYFKKDVGKERGGAPERARVLRAHLQELLRPHVATSLEPSQVERGSKAETGGSLCVKAADGSDVSHILIIKVKEEFGTGNCSAAAQLAGHYAKQLVKVAHLPAAQLSCYPAFGLEVVGNMFRVHALYYTNKVNCQLLTPMLHLSDMRWAHPNNTESVMRVLKALVLSLADLEDLYQQRLPQVKNVRTQHLRQEVPYKLHEYDQVQQLGGGLVYLCRSEGQAPVVAKLLPDTSRGASSYPTDLHKEAASKGLAPDLVGEPERQPGDFMLIKTQYLDPEDGWVPLIDYDGDIELVTTAAMQALHKLQTELSCATVHGNLRASNIFVRDIAGEVQVRFIDLDLAGEAGIAKYPLCINRQLDWALPNPACQPILQEHDTCMLGRSLDALRKAQAQRKMQSSLGSSG